MRRRLLALVGCVHQPGWITAPALHNGLSGDGVLTLADSAGFAAKARSRPTTLQRFKSCPRYNESPSQVSALPRFASPMQPWTLFNRVFSAAVMQNQGGTYLPTSLKA